VADRPKSLRRSLGLHDPGDAVSDGVYNVSLRPAARRCRPSLGAPAGPSPDAEAELELGSKPPGPDAFAPPPSGAKVPATLRDPGALRFWLAVALTGICAGLGAAALTLLFRAAQELAWGVADPSALLEAALTLGTRNRQLLTRVVVPGILPLPSSGNTLTATACFPNNV